MEKLKKGPCELDLARNKGHIMFPKRVKEREREIGLGDIWGNGVKIVD